jgi:hypothetical protein
MVEELRVAVQERNGLLVDMQRLIFNSAQMEDHRPLWKYGIENGSTVNLVSRLRGC